MGTTHPASGVTPVLSQSAPWSDTASHWSVPLDGREYYVARYADRLERVPDRWIITTVDTLRPVNPTTGVGRQITALVEQAAADQHVRNRDQ